MKSIIISWSTIGTVDIDMLYEDVNTCNDRQGKIDDGSAHLYCYVSFKYSFYRGNSAVSKTINLSIIVILFMLVHNYIITLTLLFILVEENQC